MASKAEILEQLDLGSSVAENDENLSSYFVPTVALEKFLTDRYDIIKGAKGSGKSAILKVATQRAEHFAPLRDVCLVVATEHTGEPAFRRAFSFLADENIEESRLVNAWKSYLLNLAMDSLEDLPPSSETAAAVQLAKKSRIRYRTNNTLKKVWWSLLRFLHVKSFTVGKESISAEFPDAPPDFWTAADPGQEIIDFPELLRLCISAFRAAGKRCWLLVDRLDSAFQDKPELERKALKAYPDNPGNAITGACSCTCLAPQLWPGLQVRHADQTRCRRLAHP